MKQLSYRTTQLDVRGLIYNINEWGDNSKPLLILLHGWMDCGASFKFMAPYLTDDFYLVAPDFRGFGESEHSPNGYWFPDYYADLEVIVKHYSPIEKVNLVGHSMGGNIALIYSGLMNDRVNKVMSLDSVGLPDTESKDAPIRQREWIKETLSVHKPKVYVDKNQLKTAISSMNSELSDEVIEELCSLWARPADQEGTFVLKHDRKHRDTNPYRYQFSDVSEIWKEVKAEVGLVMARNSWLYKRAQESNRVDIAKELLKIDNVNYFEVEETGHMLHLEQPKVTAGLIKEFYFS